MLDSFDASGFSVRVVSDGGRYGDRQRRVRLGAESVRRTQMNPSVRPSVRLCVVVATYPRQLASCAKQQVPGERGGGLMS